MRRLVSRFVGVGLAAAACLATSVALGGATNTPVVYVWPDASGGGTIYGSVAGARYSLDSTESIECATEGVAGSATASCWALTSTRQYASCATSDPSLIEIIGRVNSTSLIEVSYDSSGNCTFVLVENGSPFLE
jgi:hypothetical protein